MSAITLTLRRQKAYQNTAPIPVILEDMATIADLDRVAEAESQRLRKVADTWTGWGCGAAGLSFLCLFAASFLGSFAVFLLLLGVGTTIFFLARASQTRQKALYEGELDFPNHRYQLLQRLLPVLKRDMKPKGAIGINLDLSAPDRRQKFITQMPHPRRRGWKIDFFEDPWLRLKGRFVDGTRFLLTLNQRHQIRSGRNVNGKQRTRPRFKGFDLRLDITCSPQLHPTLAQLPPLQGAVQLPHSATLKQIKITPKGLCIKVRLPEGPFPAFIPASTRPALTYRDPRQLLPSAIAQSEQDLETALYETSLAMLLSAFQVINLARLQSKHLA